MDLSKHNVKDTSNNCFSINNENEDKSQIKLLEVS